MSRKDSLRLINVALLIGASAILGCASQTASMSKSSNPSISTHGSVLLKSGTTVIAIVDGQVPDYGTVIAVGRVLVDPGVRRFEIKYDQQIFVHSVTPIIDVTITNEVETIEMDVKAGHSYIFVAELGNDGKWKVEGKDKGLDYPPVCFEVRHWAVNAQKFNELGCD